MKGSISLALLVTLAQLCSGVAPPPRFSWPSRSFSRQLSNPASPPKSPTAPAAMPLNISLPSRLGSTRVDSTPPSPARSSIGTSDYTAPKPSPFGSGIGGRSFKGNTVPQTSSSSNIDKWSAGDEDQPKFQPDSSTSRNASGNGFTFSHASRDGRNIQVEVSAPGGLPEGGDKFEEHIRKALDSVFSEGNKDKVPLMSRVL